MFLQFNHFKQHTKIKLFSIYIVNNTSSSPLALPFYEQKPINFHTKWNHTFEVQVLQITYNPILFPNQNKNQFSSQTFKKTKKKYFAMPIETDVYFNFILSVDSRVSE